MGVAKPSIFGPEAPASPQLSSWSTFGLDLVKGLSRHSPLSTAGRATKSIISLNVLLGFYHHFPSHAVSASLTGVLPSWPTTAVTRKLDQHVQQAEWEGTPLALKTEPSAAPEPGPRTSLFPRSKPRVTFDHYSLYPWRACPACPRAEPMKMPMNLLPSQSISNRLSQFDLL